MSAERPPTIAPAAAARWDRAAPAASPWLHEEVARRMEDRLQWIKRTPRAWADWQPVRGGLEGHALVARRHGLGVRGITLHVFGGVSQLEDEPPTPRAEFLIAVVGPLTSFAIGGALLALAASAVLPDGIAAAIVQYLAWINIAVGVFNLVPGFPLDGGRLLRAALWQWKGTLSRATYIASRVGAVIAFGLMGLGVLQVLAGAFVGGLWLIFIGLFLRTAADAGYTQMALR